MHDPAQVNDNPVADADPALALEERRRRIRNLIQERSQVTVTELARQFVVSAVTIRSDLTALDEVGAIVRIHGGALPRRDSDEVPIDVKQTLHRAEKMRIAAAALELIRDGDTVILDSGTTTAEIARQMRGLKLDSVNVITNALNVAVLLASAPFVNVGRRHHYHEWVAIAAIAARSPGVRDKESGVEPLLI